MIHIFKILLITFLFSAVSTAQSRQIKASEDAYVQGGETSNEALGKTSPKKLLICNSTENTKWARSTFLKFPMPKKMAGGTNIELNIPVKVYKVESNSALTFNLEVFGAANDEWDESTITWATKPLQGALLGSTEVKQSLDNKSTWIKVKLEAKEFNKLFNNKDKEVTLVLANSNFNKTSAIISSKEAFAKNVAYLQID
ncbi:hypothetical protein JCM19274_2780 [Algibacter lectus]|uniref:Carbohydrate-binding module family 96 domain-containing protein n=1 Tax=Algibacter lectus TaxID=221126 RepID=A0A090X1W4_9FLAO|nr:DNRLRE domain-containing protein [Algibacter lectus]GAL82069.1 hypothetical protein JCM19274_2780 [Algibacter lectus]